MVVDWTRRIDGGADTGMCGGGGRGVGLSYSRTVGRVGPPPVVEKMNGLLNTS